MKQLLLLPFLFVAGDRSWLVDQFDGVVQGRLQTPPQPGGQGFATGPELGMSRIVRPNSYGSHFNSISSAIRDFVPEQDNEKELLAQMEDQKIELGIYFFGQAIVDQPYTNMDYRALKGPAAITKGTIRPPSEMFAFSGSSNRFERERPDPNALPAWRDAYPIAQRAMRSFNDGGHGFETGVGDWTISARPALASDARCLACHNAGRAKADRQLKIGDPVGGVLYAYKSHT